MRIKITLNPRCAKCPYKLGVVKTLVNPCLRCRINGWRTFGHFRNGSFHGTK